MGSRSVGFDTTWEGVGIALARFVGRFQLLLSTAKTQTEILVCLNQINTSVSCLSHVNRNFAGVS